MAKSDPIALEADPSDPEDFDVSESGLARALAEREARRRGPGRPVGSLRTTKRQVTLRLDSEALDRLKAGGPGWQSRINDAVRKAAGL